MKIINVSHSIYDAKSKIYSNVRENGYMITVTFDYEGEKSLTIRTVSLKNPDTKRETYKNLAFINGAIGVTNIRKLDYIFEEDEIILVDGAIFTITIKNNKNNKEMKFEYVLSNNESEWVKNEQTNQ